MQNQDTPIDLPALIQEARARRDRAVADIISAAVKRAANIARSALASNRAPAGMHTDNAR